MKKFIKYVKNLTLNKIVCYICTAICLYNILSSIIAYNDMGNYVSKRRFDSKMSGELYYSPSDFDEFVVEKYIKKIRAEKRIGFIFGGIALVMAINVINLDTIVTNIKKKKLLKN